jgi:hypothetical protein
MFLSTGGCSFWLRGGQVVIEGGLAQGEHLKQL